MRSEFAIRSTAALHLGFDRRHLFEMQSAVCGECGPSNPLLTLGGLVSNDVFLCGAGRALGRWQRSQWRRLWHMIVGSIVAY